MLLYWLLSYSKASFYLCLSSLSFYVVVTQKYIRALVAFLQNLITLFT